MTVAGETHSLPPLFMVLATQNLIEQEGTYPLPEAQMDRFLMHVMIRYPDEDSEMKVLALVRGEEGGVAAGTSTLVTRARGLFRAVDAKLEGLPGRLSQLALANFCCRRVAALPRAWRIRLRTGAGSESGATSSRRSRAAPRCSSSQRRGVRAVCRW